MKKGEIAKNWILSAFFLNNLLREPTKINPELAGRDNKQHIEQVKVKKKYIKTSEPYRFPTEFRPFCQNKVLLIVE